jgi:GNAT superfamily N-acetyltransferase
VTSPMRIVPATAEDMTIILGLIGEAAAWLQDNKGLDQWKEPWPNVTERDARVMRGLLNNKTWLVWDEGTPVATVTMATRANPKVWTKPECTCDLSERAVYVHRLITARGYAGRGLGAELIDWAGRRARRQYGAKWIRIDVWTSNIALHDYYLNKGFQRCGWCADPTYPSGALFQKPVAQIEPNRTPLFTESPARELVPA